MKRQTHNKIEYSLCSRKTIENRLFFFVNFDTMNTRCRMQKRGLILGMAFLFLIIFVSFGVIIFMEKGNPFVYIQAKKEIEQYIEKNYPHLYDEFNVSVVSYRPKENSYSLTVSDKRNENLSFRIFYNQEKQVEDTYQFDYVEGNNFLPLIENELSKELNKKMEDSSFLLEFSSYRVSIPPLDELEKEEKEALILQKEIDDLPIYTVEASTTVTNMNASTFTSQFEKLHRQTKQLSFYPVAYSLLICKTDDANYCIQINNVENDLIETGNLELELQKLLQENNQTDNESSITYEVIEK